MHDKRPGSPDSQGPAPPAKRPRSDQPEEDLPVVEQNSSSLPAPEAVPLNSGTLSSQPVRIYSPNWTHKWLKIIKKEPDPASRLVQCDLLRRYSLAVNTEHNLLLCRPCQSFVNPSAIHDHFKGKEHAAAMHAKPGIHYQREVSTRYPSLVSDPKNPQQRIAPMEGLFIHPNYVACPSCNRAWKTIPRNGHCSDPACAAVLTPTTVLKTFAQQFSRNTRYAFFGVLPVQPAPVPTDPALETHLYDLWLSMNPTPTPIAQNALSIDERAVRSFLKDFKWIEHIRECGIDDDGLQDLHSRQLHDAALRNYLTKSLTDMLNEMQDSLQSDPFLRYEVGRRPPTEHTPMETVSHKIVRSQTLARYATYASSLILFLRRVPLTSYRIEIPPELSTLVEKVCVLTEEQVAEYEPTLTAEEEDDAREEDSIEPLNEHGEPTEDNEPTGTGTSGSIPRFGPSQIAIRALLRFLLLHTPTNSSEARFHSPVTHYLVVSSTRKGGDWVPTTHITQKIAGLACIFRLVLSNLIMEESFANQRLHAQTIMDYHFVLDPQKQGVLPTLYTTLRLMKGLRGAEEGVTYFSAPDWTGKCAFNGTNVVHISHIKSMVEQLCKEVSEALDDLTFKNPEYDIDWTKDIFDQPRCLTSGFSFIDDERNAWSGTPPLLQYMLNTPSIAQLYVRLVPEEHGDGGFKLEYDMYRFRCLLKRIFEVQKKLIVLVMTTYGAPARGTELASNLIRNVPGGSIRNIFHNFGITFLRGSYNKTTGLTGLDQTMARAPLPQVSRLLIRFSVFLRPLYLSIQRIFQYRFIAIDENKLFMGLTSPIESSDLALFLESESSRLISIRLTLSWFRQFMAYISTHHEDQFPLKAVDTGVAQQLGHSSKVDTQHYGLDRNLPPNTDYQSLKKSILTSGTFQRIFGLGTEILDTVLRVNHGLHPSPATVPGDGEPAGLLPERDLANLSLAISRNLLPTFVNSMQHCVQSSHAAVVHLFHPTKPIVRTGHNTCIEVSPRLVHQLREFFGAPGSTMGFTDQYQAQATQIAAERRDSLLLVTATGSGKTLPALIATRFYDAPGDITVYIVPYNAMHEQFRARLRDAGISHSCWHRGITAENAPQSIIVTCDTAVTDSFDQFLCEAAIGKRLARVIFDEAHLIIRQEDFRPVMKQLRFLAQRGIQLLLLTATLPIALQPRLLEYVGLTAPIVLRGATPRPNISYRIIRVTHQSEVYTKVQEVYSAIADSPETGRILIFCRQVSETSKLAQLLSIEPCYSGLGQTQIDNLLTRFRSGEVKAIATTCVLGVGLDIPGVTHVLHAGNPRDIIDFAQDTGRAGRDKATKKAFSVVISSPVVSSSPASDDPAVAAIEEYLKNTTRCRRLLLQEPLDGSALPCAMLGPETHLCDICLDASRPSASQTSSLVTPSRLPSVPVRANPTIPNLGSHLHIASLHTSLSQPSPGGDLFPLLHRLIEAFSHRCVLCTLRGNEQHKCRLSECDRHDPQDATFLKTITSEIKRHLPPDVCTTCLLPQSGTYLDSTGNKARIHPWVDNSQGCILPGTLFEILFVAILPENIDDAFPISVSARFKDPAAFLDALRYLIGWCNVKEQTAPAINALLTIQHLSRKLPGFVV